MFPLTTFLRYSKINCNHFWGEQTVHVITSNVIRKTFTRCRTLVGKLNCFYNNYISVALWVIFAKSIALVSHFWMLLNHLFKLFPDFEVLNLFCFPEFAGMLIIRLSSVNDFKSVRFKTFSGRQPKPVRCRPPRPIVVYLGYLISVNSLFMFPQIQSSTKYWRTALFLSGSTTLYIIHTYPRLLLHSVQRISDHFKACESGSSFVTKLQSG